MAVTTPSIDPVPIATMVHMVTIKLSSSNYLLWKSQFLPMLEAFDLIGHIDGKPPVPASGDTSTLAPDSSAWRARDKKVLGVLFSTLTEESMAEVVGCTTVRDAWLALAAAFSHWLTSRANQLREELLFLHRGSLSVADFGRKFKSLCD